MSPDTQEIRDQILLATLPNVVFEGWTPAATAAEPDFPRVFPGGMAELAGHFSEWADRRMVAEMARLDIPGLRVRERIAAGVRLRLQVLSPHREAVRRLMTFLALPHNGPSAIRATWQTAGEIWYAAGDQSADFNYYTKRALLVPVLASTTLAWLADESDDFAETWAFLDRRIAEVLKIPPLKARLTERLSQLPSPVDICKRFAAAAGARR